MYFMQCREPAKRTVGKSKMVAAPVSGNENQTHDAYEALQQEHGSVDRRAETIVPPHRHRAYVVPDEQRPATPCPA